MFIEIGDLLGVKFSENMIKSIATGIVSNLASYMILSFGLNAVFSMIPFLSSISGAAITFVSVIASGLIYLNILDQLFVSRNNFEEKSEEELKKMAEETIKNSDIDSMTKDLKEVYKQNKDSRKEKAEEQKKSKS